MSCTKKDVFEEKLPFSGAPLAKCINGFAGEYPCNDYDLLAHISLTDLNLSTAGNDCWGWTDPLTNNEYALMGSNKTLTFIDITDPISPKIIGLFRHTNRFKSVARREGF